MTYENYLQKWNLTDAKKLAETPTSHVYFVNFQGSGAVLKVLTEIGQKDEAGAQIALRCFEGRGAVRLLMAEPGAYLLSFADGKSLKEVVYEGNDSMATQIICKVLDQLHRSSNCSTLGLKTLSETFQSLFNHASIAGADSVILAGADCASELLDSEQAKVVLHGDIHQENIIHSSSDGWLAIDPKGLFGERTYDFANVFFNPLDMPDLVESTARIIQIANIFSKHFEVDPIRILKFTFAYGCLSACWEEEDGLNPQRRMRIARMIQKLI